MNHPLLQQFTAYNAGEGLWLQNNHLLIAVSGGVDSVVLCALCHASSYSFGIAHCNFKLRGLESDEDALFVKELALKYGVDYHEKEFNTNIYAADNKLSIQVAARELRYNWFKSLLNNPDAIPSTSGFADTQYDHLLTAHHADDNIETILMNFFKGTGINGMKGILSKQGKIVRPLLFASKETIVQYAQENKLAFREDSSNESLKYTRNYFRNELIPGIEKVFPAVKVNLAGNAEKFRDIYYFYRLQIDSLLKKLIKREGEEQMIPVLKLASHPAVKTIIYEIIKEHGFAPAQVTEVIKLMSSESGKFISSATHRILLNRKWLVISRLDKPENKYFLIEQDAIHASYDKSKLNFQVHQMPQPIIQHKNTAQADLSKIEFPLLLRRWKQGDYFYPLGMAKKKKLSRFFIDNKLSLNQKENIWVLESNKKIFWIIGHRIDDRFKITASTKELLQVEWGPAE